MTGWRTTAWIACAMLFAASANAQDDAAALKDAPRRGLCVHLGCGSEASPDLIAALATRSEMLVHGIALDDASQARARKALDDAKLDGRATVEKVAVNPLPYLDDMANLVVIEDMGALKAAGLTMDDVLRITAPGGAVCVKTDGAWTKTVKPRPAGMDDWRHPMHGADGNWVSNDKLIRFPIGLRWIHGLPQNITAFTDCRSWLVVEGRLFTLGMNEFENLGRPVGGSSRYEQFLSAYDAFNGLPLWKLNLRIPDDGKTINWANTAPVAADDSFVYCVFEKNNIIKVDASTGGIVWKRETKHPVYRLVLDRGVVVAASWGEAESIWFTLYPIPDTGVVDAFDAKTGKSLWQRDFTARLVMAGNDAAFFEVRRKGPSTVHAVDLKTGRDLWSFEQTEGEIPDLELSVAGEGFVVVNRVLNKKQRYTAAVDPRTGKELWDAKAKGLRGSWTPVVNGELWVGGEKIDPLTGRDKGKFGTWLGGQGCSPRSIVFPYIVTARSGNYVQLPAGDDPAEQAKTLVYNGARAACVEGMIAANGMFYTAQNNCKCTPAHVYGFLAIGPTGGDPDADEFARARPVEKGPAFGKADDVSPASSDWPMYRSDARRSASVDCEIPADVEVLWKAQVASPREGPLADALNVRLTSCLSAPIVAAGRVFAAAVDDGRLVALDAASGREAWSITLPSRVETPPTFHRGLLLAGCHDGWLYALRATDGALAWRTRVAPRERRLVVNGRVESVWPAAGSVMIDGNTAYVTAGRCTESDGGIAMLALDPQTGALRWVRSIGSGYHRLNDIPLIRDGQLAWRYLTLDRETGRTISPETTPTMKDFGGGKGDLEGAIMDGSYTQIGNRRAGRIFRLGDKRVDIMAWNDRLAVTSDGAFSRDGATELWKAPRQGCVTALALARNAAVYVGRNARKAKPGAESQLLIIPVEEGKAIRTVALDDNATYDGVAVAGGRICVSLRNGVLICLGAKEQAE